MVLNILMDLTLKKMEHCDFTELISEIFRITKHREVVVFKDTIVKISLVTDLFAV